MFGTVKGRITTSFGSISNSLPSGKENLVIVSYGLNGTGQSAFIPEEVAMIDPTIHR